MKFNSALVIVQTKNRIYLKSRKKKIIRNSLEDFLATKCKFKKVTKFSCNNKGKYISKIGKNGAHVKILPFSVFTIGRACN